jgi:hypothetical protein
VTGSGVEEGIMSATRFSGLLGSVLLAATMLSGCAPFVEVVKVRQRAPFPHVTMNRIQR